MGQRRVEAQGFLIISSSFPFNPKLLQNKKSKTNKGHPYLGKMAGADLGFLVDNENYLTFIKVKRGRDFGRGKGRKK